MNKGILVLGAAGSGKTTYLEKLYKSNTLFEYVKWVNPDFYVEDKDHEYYNNPLGASRYIKKEIFPELFEEERDFIFDTTGANIKTLKKLIDDNPTYDFKIIIIFCHPIISFRRNLLRKRKLPKQVILQNWYKVYSQFKEYRELVGSGNIYIQDTDYTSEEREFFKEAGDGFINKINFLLRNYDATSSFKKENTEYTNEEIKEKDKKFNDICILINKEYKNIIQFPVEVDLRIEEIQDKLIEWILEDK